MKMLTIPSLKLWNLRHYEGIIYVNTGMIQDVFLPIQPVCWRVLMNLHNGFTPYNSYALPLKEFASIAEARLK